MKRHEKYRIDVPFEHSRLVDVVTVLEEPLPQNKNVRVFSPKIGADIIVPMSAIIERVTKEKIKT